MRASTAILFGTLFVLSGGCGAHMATMHTLDGGTHMSGTVLSIDGSTSDLWKASVSAPDLGVSVACDAAGRFDLGEVPARRMRMHLRAGDTQPIEAWMDLTGCRQADLRLVVEGGRITRATLEHCGDHHGTQTWTEMHDAMHDGEGVALDHGFMHDGDMMSGGMHDGGMHDGGMMGGGMMGGGMMGDGMMGDGTVSNGPCGDAGMHLDGDGTMGFAVALEGLAPGSAVEVTLIDDAGTRWSLGSFTVDADGRVLMDWNDEGGLPFGVGTMRDLAGMTLEVTSGDTVLLSATLPDMGTLGAGC